MTAPLPHGLIRVVSATHTEVPSDPADVAFERKTALHNFWKVHNAQSRTTHSVSDIRCRQLFWRVWGDQRLSVSLAQATLMQLWFQCQRDFDLSPFDLRISSSESSAYTSASSSTTQIAEKQHSRECQIASSSVSISPTQSLPKDSSYDDGNGGQESSKQRQQPRILPRPSDPKPGLNRTLSGETNRKRSTVATRGKARPSIGRKRSSQTAPQISENTKPRKSIIKSPRTSYEGSELTEGRRDSRTAFLAETTATPITNTEPPGRKISAFELPSASSWQSVESHAEPRKNSAEPSTSLGPAALAIDTNFRERFTETQKQLRSSTNLAGMNKAMRKTGSVVRFADEVDMPENFRKHKGSDRRKNSTSPQFGVSAGPSHHERQQPKSEVQERGWRPGGIERHDSVGSVAAVSDDGSEDHDADAVTLPLPRTKSQLSLAIASMKRSQSVDEQDVAGSYAVTSPQIEEEQEALISGKAARKSSEEEEKLLAMGRKDGVTRQGGVNLPKELTVKGKFQMPGDGYESPEEPTF